MSGIRKSIVMHEDGFCEMDTIEHEGLLWLVPTWIDTATPGYSTPERIVCLSMLAHALLPPGDRYLASVQNPIPKSVLYGPGPSSAIAGYVVRFHPGLAFETHSSGPVH